MEIELIIGFFGPFLALLAANTPIYTAIRMSRDLRRVTGKTEVLQKRCPPLKEESKSPMGAEKPRPYTSEEVRRARLLGTDRAGGW